MILRMDANPASNRRKIEANGIKIGDSDANKVGYFTLGMLIKGPITLSVLKNNALQIEMSQEAKEIIGNKVIIHPQILSPGDSWDGSYQILGHKGLTLEQDAALANLPYIFKVYVLLSKS